MGYIKNASYLTGETTPAAVKHLSPRRNDVLFGHMESSIAGSDLTNIPIIILITDEQIFFGVRIIRRIRA